MTQPRAIGNPFRVVSRRVIYRGRVIELVEETLERHGRRMVRETIRHPGAVVIVPMLDARHLVFVRQYRRAVGRYLLELPAGTLDRHETPAQCAKRELEEETGWRATHLKRLGKFYAAPGVLSEQLTIFLATGLARTRAHPEADEELEPVTLTMTQALAAVRSSRICDGKSIIGVLFAHERMACDLSQSSVH